MVGSRSRLLSFVSQGGKLGPWGIVAVMLLGATAACSGGAGSGPCEDQGDRCREDAPPGACGGDVAVPGECPALSDVCGTCYDGRAGLPGDSEPAGCPEPADCGCKASDRGPGGADCGCKVSDCGPGPGSCADAEEDCSATPCCPGFVCSEEAVCLVEDPASLVITCVGREDGDPCSDGDACTVDDRCEGGECMGAAAELPEDTACASYSCDPGRGVEVAHAEGGCDDGDACTSEDSCAAGLCRGVPLDYPTEVADDDPCTVDYCDPALGVLHVPGDGPCDDGDPCTTGDRCDPSGGACAGTPRVVPDDANPCTEDTCDRSTGAAAHVAVADGTLCDDGDPCSEGDACAAGVCAGAYPDDGDACTRFDCASGTHLPLSRAEVSALPGSPFSAEDAAEACLRYECAVGAGDTPKLLPVADDTPCADPDRGREDGPCATWLCRGGACTSVVEEERLTGAGVPNPDAMHPDCRQRSCNAFTGEVVYVPMAEGLPCDDGNPCTRDDACSGAGRCEGGDTEAADGAACEDGDACSIGGACRDGLCEPLLSAADLLRLAGEVPDPELHPDVENDVYRDPAGLVAAGSACREYACDPALGLIVAAADNGAACDDGNPCTRDECRGGLCVGVADEEAEGEICLDLSAPCYEGHCSKGACVAFAPLSGVPCEPEHADPCLRYACDIGACLESSFAPPETSCDDDPDDCTSYSCDGAGSCVDAAVSDGTPCGDESGGFDLRCSSPECFEGRCEENPFERLQACALAAEDLPGGAAPGDLECNEGRCDDATGVMRCTPVAANLGDSCEDEDPCDGVDWCEDRGQGVGRCDERYEGGNPPGHDRHLDPSDPLCADGMPLGAQGQAPDPRCYDNAGPRRTVEGYAATWCEADGDPATTGRCAYDGTCKEMSQLADDGDDCTVPVMDEAGRSVVFEPVPDWTPCNPAALDPCRANRGVCLDGACRANPVPDGAPCVLAGRRPPNAEEGTLPDGHAEICHGMACVAGECVADDTRHRDGLPCDDGETVCSAPGRCEAGRCEADDSPRGNGEACPTPAAEGIVDMQGRPVEEKDLACWVGFECDGGGACVVAAVPARDETPCDFGGTGDRCDGWCRAGACEAHPWESGGAADSGCEDGNPCTQDRCTGGAESRCEAIALNGEHGTCRGVAEDNPCKDRACEDGDCVLSNNDDACDDGNPCTRDKCAGGVCAADEASPHTPAGTPCDGGDAFFDDGDEDCRRDVCDGAGECVAGDGVEADGSFCEDGNPCTLNDRCDGAGSCSPGADAPDGSTCDTNGAPCDEACFDLDGAGGGAESSACVPFATFGALLNPAVQAADGSAPAATGSEEIACRALLDPTFDPEASDPESSGHGCARFVCYAGACRTWNHELPADAGLPPNPTDGRECHDSGPCTAAGTCSAGVCRSYHRVADGTPCGPPSCGEEGDLIYTPTCQAGVCLAGESLLGSCSRGVATCQGSACVGAGCSERCVLGSVDWVNVFEDISRVSTSLVHDLTSPLNPQVTCGAPPSGPTEEQRMACDDGSVLLDLENDLGFHSPDGEGFWFYGRRYRMISVSANGAVLFHRDTPGAPGRTPLFVVAPAGGEDADLAALATGAGAAQMRAFFDDLSFITDPTQPTPDEPDSPYEGGDFELLGELHTRHMPGPTAAPQDDYLIVQWSDAAFYGCAGSSPATRSRMTFQLKWWPHTGMAAVLFPHGRSDDGAADARGTCTAGRSRGAYASVGLVDEGGAAGTLVGEEGRIVSNDTGPGTDPFDDYFLFWPLDRPATGYGWRGHEPFEDLSLPDPETGAPRGQVLDDLSACNGCCQRVELSEPFFYGGEKRHSLRVCADGYLAFDGPGSDERFAGGSVDNTGFSLADQHGLPVIAPWWSSLMLDRGSHSRVLLADETGTAGQGRRLIVQWTRVDYEYKAAQAEQSWRPLGERGETLCSDRVDNENDGAADCDDSSCACAAACGGQGCGLSFEAVLHDGLGFTELRYLSTARELGMASGDSQHGLSVGAGGLDLYDQCDGGDSQPCAALDAADADELSTMPGAHHNVLLPLSGWLQSPR